MTNSPKENLSPTPSADAVQMQIDLLSGKRKNPSIFQALRSLLARPDIKAPSPDEIEFPPLVQEFFSRGRQMGFYTSESDEIGPSLTSEVLATAHRQGSRAIHTLKNWYLDNLVSWRERMGLGLPMKGQAQIILQEPNGQDRAALGDESTWLVDFSDPKSILTLGQYLLTTANRSPLWLGFAMPDDFVDPSGDKSVSPPLIVGMTSLLHLAQVIGLVHGKIKLADLDQGLIAANTRRDGTNRLSEIDDLIHQTLLTKLARRLAKIDIKEFQDLLKPQQAQFLSQKRQEAETILSSLTTAADWQELNDRLVAEGQKPISPVPDFLGKLFAQDNPKWKIGDLIVTGDSLNIEVPPHKFSARPDLQSQDNQGSKIKIVKGRGDKLFVFANQEDLIWLKPFMNSPSFLGAIQHTLFPRLGDSPYHQIQFMYELGEARDGLQSLEDGKLACITDVVTGLHKINPEHNGHQLLDLPSVFEAISQSSPNVIYFSPDQEIIFTKTIPTLYSSIYEILVNVKKGKEESPEKASSLLETLTSLSHFSLTVPSTVTRILRELRAKSKPRLDNLDKTILYFQNWLRTNQTPDT